MTTINLIVTGTKAVAETDGKLTSGSSGIPVTIQYDSTWDGLRKAFVCTSGKWGPTGAACTTLDIESTAAVPHDVMIADHHLYIGVEGRNGAGDLVLCTAWADCGIIFPGASVGADPSADPTLPVWAQLQAQIEELKTNGLSDGLKTALTDYYTHVMPHFDDANGMGYVNGILTALGAETRSGSGSDDAHVHSYTAAVTRAPGCETAGVRTYTCTCGDSYTEEIPATGHSYADGLCTVCGAADPEQAPAATEPVYQLAQAQVFDGTAAFDTGHALWGGGNGDFTICLDFTDAATPKTTYPMYIVGQTFTAAYLYFYKTYNGGAFNVRYNSGAATAIGIASGTEHAKIVVSHAAGQTGITVHTASGDTPLASSSNYPTNDAATVQLGANGFTGTVHDFRVYDRVLTADEINEYLEVNT